MNDYNVPAALAAIAAAVLSVAAWQSPDALRWCIVRLAMRVAYIEAGNDAAAIEQQRLEGQGRPV